ncbi:MAG: hypothetical protein IT566_16365 [Rhodospirillaceae bacterium]|nr:hypothetical protein [Rhodospirillaceae bacterium]
MKRGKAYIQTCKGKIVDHVPTTQPADLAQVFIVRDEEKPVAQGARLGDLARSAGQ